MAGSMRRAAATDTATERLEPGQRRGAHRCKPPNLNLRLSRGARDGGADAIKDGPRASAGPHSSLKEQHNWVFPLWAEDGLGRGPSRETEVDSTQRTQQIAWPRRAPQGRAPSASGGKRRTPDSWIRLVNSLEETKRNGARARSGVTWPPHRSSPPPAAAPMRTLWCISSGALFPLLVPNPGGERSWGWPRRRVPRAQSLRSEDAETKAHCPDSSTWEKPGPVHPPNAGAPSSKLCAEARAAESAPAGRDGGAQTDQQAADPQPQPTLTH